MVSYPFLERGLRLNHALREFIFSDNPWNNPEFLSLLETLFKGLFSNACEGLDEKVQDTGSTLSQLKALLSELNYARFFLQNKMQVEFLTSNSFDQRTPPDMIVKGNGKEYYVEVKNIQLDDQDYEFGKNIENILNDSGLKYMIIIKSISPLSVPAYQYNDYQAKEDACTLAIEEFKEKLKKTSFDQLPVTIQTRIADVELYSTTLEKSYVGISTMAEAISETREYSERIKWDIKKKAHKRENWIGEELDKLYLVAIDDDAIFFYIDRYNKDLFGSAHYYQEPLKVPEGNLTDEIKRALETGWSDYLTKVCILRNKRSIINKQDRGLFFTEPLLRNVTGVLVRHRADFYLLANPFAENRINDSAIISDFPKCKTGWE